MILKRASLLIALTTLSTSLLAYDGSGYHDEHLYTHEFEQAISETLPEVDWDRDSQSVQAELPVELEQALHVDGVSVDLDLGVYDHEGNYLGQADELYGLDATGNWRTGDEAETEDESYQDDYYSEEYVEEEYIYEEYVDETYDAQYN